jgi:hypothetical protein
MSTLLTAILAWLAALSGGPVETCDDLDSLERIELCEDARQAPTWMKARHGESISNGF